MIGDFKDVGHFEAKF